MTRDDVIRWARAAGFQTGVVHGPDGNPVHPLVLPVGHGCIVELERVVALAISDAVAAERQKRREAEGMAECMDMVRQELISAGIISKDVPPMMVPEAVVSALHSRVAAEREACAQVCDGLGDPWESTGDYIACAAAIRARGKA